MKCPKLIPDFSVLRFQSILGRNVGLTYKLSVVICPVRMKAKFYVAKLITSCLGIDLESTQICIFYLRN